MNELEVTLLLCAWLGSGDVETTHKFGNLGRTRAVRVDCETDTHVIEVGFDGKPASRDSLHQALFAAELTGKVPMFIVVDRDGAEGRYEQELRVVAARAGVAFARCTQDFIVRWRMTQPYRALGLDKSLDDLPDPVAVWGRCDIARVYRESMPG